MYVCDRLRKLQPNLFHTSIHFKQHHVTRHSEPLEDHDCTTAPHSPNNREGECLELKDYDETGEDKDKDYYFMDTTLLGQLYGEHGKTMYTCMHAYVVFSVAGEHEKPVLVSKFSSHVERLHADRDKLFEMEYAVSNCMLSLDDNVCI